MELFFFKIYQLSVRAKGSLLSDSLQTNIQNQHTLLALVFFCVLNLPSVILSRSGSTVQWFAQSPNKWKILSLILGGDTNSLGVVSGKASGVKICHMKYVELPPKMHKGASKVTFIYNTEQDWSCSWMFLNSLYFMFSSYFLTNWVSETKNLFL